MNETTKRIVDDMNALYMRATDEYFKLTQLLAKCDVDLSETLDRDVIVRELTAALEICNALFSAKMKCNRARAERR